MKLKWDVMTRSRCLGLGINVGNNYRVKKKWKNIFLEIDLLWWVFGVDLYW